MENQPKPQPAGGGTRLPVNLPPHVQAMIDRYGVPPFHHDLEDLLAFVRGELPESESAEVREHLATCSECAESVDDFRDLLGMPAAVTPAEDERGSLPPLIRAMIELQGMPVEHSDPDDLLAYVRGELTGEELREVEAHLPSCAECRERVSDLRVLLTPG